MFEGLFSRNRVLSAVIAGLGLFLIHGPSAHAAIIQTDACDNATLTTPFAHWGDSSPYKLMPGGSFEGASGWSFSGGAKVVSGSEPFGATGSVGTSSAYIPMGGSAQSPFTCVDAAYPSFRFFVRNNGLLSTMAVTLVYKTVLGLELPVPAGAVALTTKWSPSASMLTLSVVTGVLTNGVAQVALRFTSLTGSTNVDDVFVDPRMRT